MSSHAILHLHLTVFILFSRLTWLIRVWQREKIHSSSLSRLSKNNLVTLFGRWGKLRPRRLGPLPSEEKMELKLEPRCLIPTCSSLKMVFNTSHTQSRHVEQGVELRENWGTGNMKKGEGSQWTYMGEFNLPLFMLEIISYITDHPQIKQSLP